MPDGLPAMNPPKKLKLKDAEPLLAEQTRGHAPKLDNRQSTERPLLAEQAGHVPERHAQHKLQMAEEPEGQPGGQVGMSRGDKPPFALDMFSGKNAPVAYALAWCGWRVEPVDWLLNERHDLSKPWVQNGVATQAKSCDAAIWAVDCSTLSRAREVAIPGHHAPPKPLRGESHVRGLPSLNGRDAERVEQANSFIDFTFAQIAQLVSDGKAAILESPARSHLWGFQQLKDIRKMPQWRRTQYDACCWGGARRKKQALESNVPEIHEIECTCHHTLQLGVEPGPSGRRKLALPFLRRGRVHSGPRLRYSSRPQLVGSPQRKSEAPRPPCSCGAGHGQSRRLDRHATPCHEMLGHGVHSN